MKWVKHSVRFLLVTVGIIVLTSLSIDATQYLSGSQSALGIFADKVTESDCPLGMAMVSRPGGSYCIDVYEQGVGDACPIAAPGHYSQTAENLAAHKCTAVSEIGKMPWRHVTYTQAKEICARSGKRLPTNSEWYEAALGSAENVCGVDESGVTAVGSHEDCRSGYGAYDMIGNVWEWVDATVSDGQFQGRKLPEEGYVERVDIAGVATEISETPNVLFGNDYFWSKQTGDFAMMRGGFFGSKSDAGIYTVQAGVDTAFAGDAVGFRCVLDL